MHCVKVNKDGGHTTFESEDPMDLPQYSDKAAFDAGAILVTPVGG